MGASGEEVGALGGWIYVGVLGGLESGVGRFEGVGLMS